VLLEILVLSLRNQLIGGSRRALSVVRIHSPSTFPLGHIPRPDDFPPNLGHSPGC